MRWSFRTQSMWSNMCKILTITKKILLQQWEDRLPKGIIQSSRKVLTKFGYQKSSAMRCRSLRTKLKSLIAKIQLRRVIQLSSLIRLTKLIWKSSREIV